VNRKMRAKANNQAARAKRERPPAPVRCEDCGGVREPVVALVVVDEIVPDKRSLH
jgi:hypothetical protein